MAREVSGTDEPLYDWQYGGSHYRLSLVGGLIRMEQQLRGGSWYMIEPNHDAAAMLVCADELVKRLREAEVALLRCRFRTQPEAQA